MHSPCPPGQQPAPPILVVDDEEIVLVALRKTLEFAGYKIVTCPHASHALNVIQEEAFSVVISDHHMPLVSGLEFLMQVMRRQPNATRILITAVMDLDTIMDAVNKAEIYRFIVKPWLREDLVAAVRDGVQRYDQIVSHWRLQQETLAANMELTQLNQRLQVQAAQLAQENARLQSLLLSLRAPAEVINKGRDQQ